MPPTKREVVVSGPTSTVYASLGGGGGSSGLTTDQKIAIGVGVFTGVCSILGGIGAWHCIKKRKENGQGMGYTY